MPPLTDILPHVIRFLDVVDLARLLSVCQAWYRIGHQAWIWRRFCLEPGTSGRLALGPDLLPPGLDADQMRSLLVSLRRFSSPIMPFSIIKRGIYQSSCDHESQTISQTLDSKRDTFWSSTGSASSADGALLVYELAHGLCVVRSISITPFRAFYQQGMQCYGPVRARVTILLRADDDSSITYRGPWASIDNRHEPQAFDLGRELIVGGAFRLELDGRWSRQPGDHLYYVCLRDVVCKGVPVAAAASDAFLRVVHARVRRSDAGRAMPYRTLGRVVFQDRTAIQAIVVKELTRQRLLMKCKALIGCEQIDDVVAIVFPAYADDVAFRDDVADALLASDDTSSLASYIGARDARGGVLSDVESIMVAQLAIRSANATPFGDYVAALRVSFTERLGDLFFEAGDYACAMTCFSGAMIPDKLLITCAHLCSRPGNVLYLTVLMRTYEYGPETVAMIVAILRRRHHPHIACVFVDRMLQDGAIDLGTAATLLQVPSPALPSYMRKQASLFQESCDRSSGNASSSLEP